MNFMEQKTSVLFMGLLFFAACGQDVSRNALRVSPTINPIVVDPGTDPGSPFGETLGRTSFAVTVNRAKIGIGNEPNENHYALLRTFEGPNSPGAYYGLGLGSQAQVGFGLDSAGLKIDAFQSLQFKVYEPVGPVDCENHVSLKLLIDLNCDSLNPDYRVVTTDPFVPKQKEEWTTFQINAADSAFRFVRTTAPLRSLKSLLKNSPSACFVSGDVFDLGMKRDQKLAPFQLIFGDRFYFESSSVRLDDLELNVAGSIRTEDFES